MIGLFHTCILCATFDANILYNVFLALWIILVSLLGILAKKSIVSVLISLISDGGHVPRLILN